MKGAKFGLTENMRLQLTVQEEKLILDSMDKVSKDFYSNDSKITRAEEDGTIWFHEVSDCIYSARMDGVFIGLLLALGFDENGKRMSGNKRDSL
jgi:hypothetical protein